MKDLPLPTLLPIMLETAEMSSDVEELSEEFDTASISAEFGMNSPPSRRRSSAETASGGPRRCSLPCERPAGTLRRHFNQLKPKRKVSAPSPPPFQPGGGSKIDKSPVSASNPLSELWDKIRSKNSPASSIDSGAGCIPASIMNRPRVHRRVSLDVPSTTTGASESDDGFHSGSGDDYFWKPLFVDTKLANSSIVNAPATVPRQCLYYRQASLIGGGIAESQFHVQRQRSHSETGRYLLMRKCGDFIAGSEVVGKLEAEWAYCQILATMKCSDLMPQLAKMVVVDANLSIRKAFMALVHNNIRAAPIWDSQRHLFSGLLTVTDLIRILMEHIGDSNDAHSSSTTAKGSENENEEENMTQSARFETLLNLPLNQRSNKRDSPKHSSDSSSASIGTMSNSQHFFNHLIYALADESVSKAAKLLCDRRLHRLVILDPEKGGNPLFLLTKKNILKALRKYIAKLPLPACMEKSLDEIAVGTWSNLVTVGPDVTLYEALSIFLDKGLSALPVVNERGQVMDMLTKVDALNLVIENAGPVDEILKKSVKDAIAYRSEGSEKMTTCFKKTTLLLAVECILHSDAHRLAIVDSDGKLEGVLALADLMRFLSSGFACE